LEAVFIISVLIASALGAIFAYVFVRTKANKIILESESEIQSIKEKASQSAESIIKDAKFKGKEIHFQKKQEFENETSAKRKELHRQEKKLLQREENIDKKADFLGSKEIEVIERERVLLQGEVDLTEKFKSTEQLLSEAKSKLERIANLTQEEAKEELKSAMTDVAKKESIETIKRIERETRQAAEERAKEIICLAIQRISAEYVSETTVSVVPLESEDMKGRIIGREGRNIRAIESSTGVDVIIDDTPEAVVLSSFDPIRREKAKILLQKLLADGRIHPARIEVLAGKVDEELESHIKESGESAAFDIGVNGVRSELLRLLGKLKYKTLGQQSVLQQSVEVAVISGILAAELGMDVKMAKRAGILHNIGMAVGQEIEGSYNKIGADIARKYGEPDEVVLAIENHRENQIRNSCLAVLIGVARRLSAQRPGARKEVLETYVKRLENLEQAVCSVDNVDKVYVIQAGREIRVLVDSEGVTDEGALMILKDIEKTVKEGIHYPGQISVTLLKESRATSYAK